MTRRPIGGAALRAVRVVVLVAHHVDLVDAIDLGDAVGPDADRRLGVALGAHLLAIRLGLDRHDEGDVFERGGERLLELDPHMMIVDRLGARHPVEVARHRDARFRIGDHADRVDHIGGGERIAVAELHVLAQLEFQRDGIDPFPGGGERGLDDEAIGVAIGQPVPGLMLHDQPGTQAVEIGIDIRDRVAPGDAQRVRGFLRHGRDCPDRAGDADAESHHASERTHRSLSPSHFDNEPRAWARPGASAIRPGCRPVAHSPRTPCAAPRGSCGS